MFYTRKFQGEKKAVHNSTVYDYIIMLCMPGIICIAKLRRGLGGVGLGLLYRSSIWTYRLP